MSAALLGGGWIVRRYYRFWARIRHPGFWGVPFGALAGCVILGGLFVTLILPGEARTARVLDEAQRRIEGYYKKHRAYPRPDRSGFLSNAALRDGQVIRGGVFQDGFGRPLLYRVSGWGPAASYTVKSLGFDGKLGRDDLCISGATPLMNATNAVANLVHVVEGKRGGVAETVIKKLRAIRALRCEP
jgi:hypothetical protein